MNITHRCEFCGNEVKGVFRIFNKNKCICLEAKKNE